MKIKRVYAPVNRRVLLYIRYIGTEPELRARGILHADDLVPKAPSGYAKRDGVKISKLRDGRLRVSLDAAVSAKRDPQT